MIDLASTQDLHGFVTVVDSGSFAAAAQLLEVAPSSVSRAVSRLEARLGVTLLRRTTRRLDVTPEGTRFYERVVRVLAELEEAESQAREDAGAVRGRLRVSAPVPFALHQLVPRLHRLTKTHPRLRIDLDMTDRLVNLLKDRVDVAVRIGPLQDSSLLARPICCSGLHLVGAPAYLERRGLPNSVDDLLVDHEAVRFSGLPAANTWHLRDAASGTRPLRLPSRVSANDGEGVRQLVLQGHGLARLSTFMVHEDLREGRLVEVLPDANSTDRSPIHAVYTERVERSARVNVFVEFLRREFASGEWEPTKVASVEASEPPCP